jgi:F-type H+-transporting ATPase subunit b
MPQLSQIGEIYASQLFWLAIVFALIYFGIGRSMVPKIERTIDDRNARISGDLNAAEAARARAASLDNGYQAEVDAARARAQAAMAEAKARASSAAAALVKQGDAEASAAIDKAMARIDSSRAKALAEIETATTDAVEQIVAKLSGVAVDRGAIEMKVKAALSHG